MTSYIQSKKKILIADDSEMNREMLSEILGDEYDYIYAADGEQTLEILANGSRVDILLLDMNMPKLSGMKVLKAMRERNWLEEIPVVIISAENDVNFIKNAYYLGATDYIVRPFNSFLVKHRVNNTLTMYSQKKQLVRMVESQVFRREKINNMLINIFSGVVELKNNESGSHTINVQNITNLLLSNLVKMTDKYNLSEEDIAMISSVSAIHDIGKIMVPDEILNKPGKLTTEEWEIMKKHTVMGDEFLNSVIIDPDEELMVRAHEICRHHHERYDGNGYPDGLVGDDIPISAQAVSIADVYDALTSDRCYKKAYSHEKAVAMILGGECGVFNPLLLQCFEEIADDLLVTSKFNLNDYDVEKNSYRLTKQAFDNEKMSYEERFSELAEIEKVKKEFFADRCKGIQFDYDAVVRKFKYLKYYDKDGERTLLNSETMMLLSKSDWTDLKGKLSHSTRENPLIKMVVQVPVNGSLRWHKLTVQTIWANGRPSYISIVGQFTDIHDKVVAKGKMLSLAEKEVGLENIVAMRNIFDIVRIVDPINHKTLRVDKNGNLVTGEQRCFEVWNRSEPCKNCTSRKALKHKKWFSKVELMDGKLYSVLAKDAKFGDTDCVLEVAFCIEESDEKSHSDIGFMPDSITLKHFYSDTLTQSYSRAYLESFMPKFKNAGAIAIADLDEFKKINDTYGHIVGDAALKHVSNVMKSCIRKEDILIRYGGDEFLLIFADIAEEDFFEKLQVIKQAVHDSVIEEYPDVGHDISIGGAYGIHPFEKAIDTADKAMYKDKFRNKK